MLLDKYIFTILFMLFIGKGENVRIRTCNKDRPCSAGYCDQLSLSSNDLVCGIGICRCPKGQYEENKKCVPRKYYFLNTFYFIYIY